MRQRAGVVIQKFLIISTTLRGNFWILNHTRIIMLLVSLEKPKFAPDLAASYGELRIWDTSPSPGLLVENRPQFPRRVLHDR